MNIIELRTDEIKPYDKNPRKNDEAVDGVAKSIEEFGFKVPIIIDNLQSKTIVTGHTRWKASKKLGLEKVPCIVADDLTEEQIKAFRLADNKVAEKAEWDFELLSEELQSILNIDMSGFGFDDLDLNDDEELESVVEDNVPETPELTRYKLGDKFQLGTHVLMCGDSTNPQDVAELLKRSRSGRPGRNGSTIQRGH